MPSTSRAAAATSSPALLRWSARRSHPIVLLHVTLVFLAMAALAYFGLHSKTAVQALALAWVGYLVPLSPRVFARIEYRFTDTGLESRTVEKKPREFRQDFRYDELSHVVPGRHGFRYGKHLPVSGRWRRFWRTHVSDAYGGEAHVEAEDRSRVLRFLEDRGVHLTRSVGPS